MSRKTICFTGLPSRKMRLATILVILGPLCFLKHENAAVLGWINFIVSRRFFITDRAHVFGNWHGGPAGKTKAELHTFTACFLSGLGGVGPRFKCDPMMGAVLSGSSQSPELLSKLAAPHGWRLE